MSLSRADLGRAARYLGRVLAVLGCGLLGYALWYQWPEVAAQFRTFGAGHGVVALIFAVAMLMTSSIVFGLLVDGAGSSFQLVWRAAGFYLISQVIKYVPGRLWGMVYQVERLRDVVGLKQAALASFTHLLIGLVSSLLVMGVALDGTSPVPWFGFVLLAFWVWRGGLAAWVGAAATSSIPPGRLSLIVLAVASEWMLYLGAAALLCSALGSGDRWLIVGSLYAVAWLLGSLAVVVPGGIGVREGGFVALGPMADLPADLLISFALVARFVFSGAELLTAGLAAAMLGRESPLSMRRDG